MSTVSRFGFAGLVTSQISCAEFPKGRSKYTLFLSACGRVLPSHTRAICEPPASALPGVPDVDVDLEQAVALPEHHPEGSRLYIDGAFTLFRRFNPDVVALVYNPALSIQKGCTSSLNDPKWYDTVAVTRPLVSLARRARDHWWKLRA